MCLSAQPQTLKKVLLVPTLALRNLGQKRASLRAVGGMGDGKWLVTEYRVSFQADENLSERDRVIAAQHYKECILIINAQN